MILFPFNRPLVWYQKVFFFFGGAGEGGGDFTKFPPEKYNFNLYEGFFREKVAQIRQILNFFFSNHQICTITTSQSIHPWPKRGLKICHSGLKRDLKTCHSWSKRDPKTWWKSRARERGREEKGAKKGDAAAMAPAQVRPLPSPFKRVLLRCTVDVRSAYHFAM
jgi:hypothetical protein